MLTCIVAIHCSSWTNSIFFLWMVYIAYIYTYIYIYVITRWKKRVCICFGVFVQPFWGKAKTYTSNTASYTLPGYAPQWSLKFAMICSVPFSGHQEVSWKLGNNATEVTWMLYTCSFRFQGALLYNLLYANILPTLKIDSTVVCWQIHMSFHQQEVLVPECV